MSQALYAAVDGIQTSQTAIDVISNNIANMSTTGFKSGSVTFQNVFSQTLTDGSPASGDMGGTNPMQIGMGVSVSGIQQNFNAGSVQTTGVATNLDINGNGFFTLSNPAGGMFLSRAGDFNVDANGSLVNASGLHVLGTSTVVGGSGSTTPIQIPIALNAVQNPATGTTTIANTQDGSTSMSQGTLTLTLNGVTNTVNTTGMTMTQLVTAINGLSFGGQTLAADIGVTTPGKLTISNPAANADSLTMTDGTGTLLNASGLMSVANGSGTVAAGGVASSDALTDQSSITLSAADNTASTITLSSISISDAGTIDATYSNGAQITVTGSPTRSMQYETATGTDVSGANLTTNGVVQPEDFQIQMSNVVNDNGLVSAGGNMFTVGPNAGAQNFAVGGTGGMGSLTAGSLEASNVDLSTQFSDLVTAQSAISADSKAFQTIDQVLQTMLQYL